MYVGINLAKNPKADRGQRTGYSPATGCAVHWECGFLNDIAETKPLKVVKKAIV